MKILFCLDYYYPHVGGAEILFQALAEGLVSAGNEVRVVTQLVDGTEREDEHNGVFITRVNTHNSRYLFPLAALPALLKYAKWADFLHTTTFAAAPPAWLAGKLRGKKVVLTVHEVWIGMWNKVSDAGFLSNLVNGCFERMIYWMHFARYIAVSKATKRALVAHGISADKVDVIYNGVDYEHWNPDNYDGRCVRNALGIDEEFLFMFSGRPGRSKGLPVLLKAFAELNDVHTRLVVIASRSKACRSGYDDAVALAKKLGISERVIFHESLPYAELPNWIAAADCVCVPSLSEGFGFCAAEACAMKRPVICTDNASLPEVVGGWHLLVPPNDASAFARAMRGAVRNYFDHSIYPRFSNINNRYFHMKLYGNILKS